MNATILNALKLTVIAPCCCLLHISYDRILWYINACEKTVCCNTCHFAIECWNLTFTTNTANTDYYCYIVCSFTDVWLLLTCPSTFWAFSTDLPPYTDITLNPADQLPPFTGINFHTEPQICHVSWLLPRLWHPSSLICSNPYNGAW